MHQYIQGSSIIFAPVEQNLKQLNGEIRKGTNTIISFLNRCVTFVFSFLVQKKCWWHLKKKQEPKHPLLYCEHFQKVLKFEKNLKSVGED